MEAKPSDLTANELDGTCNPAKPEIDIEDMSSGERITQPFSPNDIKLSTPPMNMGDLIDRLKYKWININTEYQRNPNLWNEQKQSRLIESVLLGLRLPAFYFEEVDKNNWNIIDGLQRCCAINNFCVDKTFALSDMEFLSSFEGKTYNQLLFSTIRDIRMLPITVNLLSAGVPNKVKYVLFKRLNTGGIELTPQEVRNAVFHGKAIDIVNEMSNNAAFLDATKHCIPVKRQQDRDFVSRFIAFYLKGYEEYTPDLDNFINNSMEDIMLGKIKDSDLEKMKLDFSRSMLLSMDFFDDDAFRKREKQGVAKHPINKAYFEVISTVFARLNDEVIAKLMAHKELFKDNLITAMRDSKSYNLSFSSGTGKRDSVKRRFSWFISIMRYSASGKEISINNDNKIMCKEF